ncbi:MAG: 3D domain-containing protein [Planctomycetota bacterium]
MKTSAVKRFRGLFLKLHIVRALALPTAIICLLGGLISLAGARTTAHSSALDSAITRTDNAELNSNHARKWQTVPMRVTAYCPCPKCCGRFSDGITACAHKIKPGDTFVAADQMYPFGAEMIVPGYNNARPVKVLDSNARPVKVLDRGGAIKGNRLDVFFHSHQQALNWGVRYIDVKVPPQS